jgi:hypothetical protein
MLGRCFSGNDIQEKILKVSNFHRKFILPIWGIVALVLVALTAHLAYIAGRKAHYTDVTQDWESCLFQPNYVTLPLGELAETSPIAPVLVNLGITVDNKDLGTGHFVNALIYLCGQTITMTFLGQVVIFRSWNHVGWILPSAFFGLWCSLLAMTYYTAAPPLPVASETTSTIILLSYWLKKSKFDNLNDGNNLCGSAYSYLVITLVLNVCPSLPLSLTLSLSVDHPYRLARSLQLSGFLDGVPPPHGPHSHQSKISKGFHFCAHPDLAHDVLLCRRIPWPSGDLSELVEGSRRLPHQARGHHLPARRHLPQDLSPRDLLSLPAWVH